MTLDEKLREIFRNPEWGQYRNNWQFEIAQIKAAFAEEGYVQVPQVEIVTRYEAGKKPELFMVNGEEVMTGQEWYDRFEKEVMDIQYSINVPEDADRTDSIIEGVEMTLLGLASKAAGLTE